MFLVGEGTYFGQREVHATNLANLPLTPVSEKTEGFVEGFHNFAWAPNSQKY
jgi:hypothetical protein